MKTGFSYFGVRRPEHVRRDMAEMASEGANRVLHTWSEDDLSYYRDTMGEIVRVSRSEGLEVYVNSWGVGRVFGGEALSELVAKNPGSNQVLSTGEAMPAICPNHPAFQDYMDGWIDAVCATDVETVFWDEPHFYFRKGRGGEWACRCAVCRSLFREWTGHDMPAVADGEVSKFRQDRLLGLLGRWSHRVRKAGKRNCICLLPDHFDAGLPDWASVAALPGVDELACDPYWEESHGEDHVRGEYALYASRLVELCSRHRLEPQMWMKLYRIKAGTEHFAPLAAELSFQAGIRNLMAWSWRSSEWLSWLRSDDPAKAHSSMVRAFADLRARA
ncbi:MAG: hypothetical protein H6686_06635 [Fibrobacteria bacterium]|nr:hypothetical protein [Fibrobacteria bacterium]